MGELEPLGSVHGHKADGVFAFAGLQRNDAPGLAEVFQVFHEFLQFDGPVDLLLLPFLHEVQHRPQDGRGKIQRKLLYDNLCSEKGLGVTATDFVASPLNGGKYGGSAFYPVDCGRERNDFALAILAGDGAHHLPQLFRGHLKTGQSRDPEQADIIAGGHHSAKAGKKVASLGRVGDIHALDDERNVGLGEFLHNVVALVMRAIEDVRNPTTCI